MEITSILLIVILLILTFWLYNWLFTSWDYWTSRGIPSVPGALPIFGNTLSIFRLQKNLLIFARTIYEAYQDKSMVGFYSLKKPVLLIRDPELVKTVLQSSFNNFNHNDASMDPEADPLFGLDPLFTRGDIWKNSRAIFGSALSIKRVKNISFAVANACKKLDNHLARKTKNKDNYEFEAKLLFTRYTVEVAAEAVLGIQGNSFADDYKGTLLHYMKMIIDPEATKAFRHNIIFFIPALRKYITTRFVPLEVDKYFRSVVTKLIDLRQKNDIATTDILQLLLDLEKNSRISKIDNVLAHSLSFVIDTFETSSITLSNLSYCIAKHQKVQSRLRAEIETVLAKYEGQLTYEAINEMSYLEQVMNETFRILPTSGIFSKAFRLVGSDGLTVEVECGTTIVISVWGLHMDPQFWENPDEFNPDRFRKSNDDDRHKFVHLPFSAGPRSCPGRLFGIIEVKAALATILRNYSIEISPKMQEPIRINPRHFLTTPVGGVWIRLRPLKSN